MDELRETLAFWGGVIMHHDKRRHKQCREKCFFLFFRKKTFPNKKLFFNQFSESKDSRCKMRSNKRRRRVRLAEKWSWIWSDGPKVPKMRRIDKTVFY